MNEFEFFVQFVKNAKKIGAVMPSSPFLARKMLKRVDFARAKVIVEFGAGTGSITKQIMRHKRRDTHFLMFEPNKHFAATLRRHFTGNRVYVIEDYAERLPEYLEKHGLSEVDYIISGLPLAAWSKPKRTKIMSIALSSLEDGGSYIQFQYSLASYQRLKELFSRVRVSLALMNLPPAFIYTCSKELSRV